MTGVHPPARLRHELSNARDGGLAFRAAWPRAVRTTLAATNAAHRGEWRAAFRSTKQSWHSAYTGTPGPGDSVRRLLDLTTPDA